MMLVMMIAVKLAVIAIEAPARAAEDGNVNVSVRSDIVGTTHLIFTAHSRSTPMRSRVRRRMKRNRTWPDGSYWSNGLACGMDNQPRTLPTDNPWTDHSFTGEFWLLRDVVLLTINSGAGWRSCVGVVGINQAN